MIAAELHAIESHIRAKLSRLRSDLQRGFLAEGCFVWRERQRPEQLRCVECGFGDGVQGAPHALVVTCDAHVLHTLDCNRNFVNHVQGTVTWILTTGAWDAIKAAAGVPDEREFDIDNTGIGQAAMFLNLSLVRCYGNDEARVSSLSRSGLIAAGPTTGQIPRGGPRDNKPILCGCAHQI